MLKTKYEKEGIPTPCVTQLATCSGLVGLYASPFFAGGFIYL